MEAQRIFVCVELPPAQQQTLGRVRDLFPPELTGLTWVAPDRVHITLRFMGNMTPEQLNLVIEAADGAARHMVPFTVRMTGLGAFPNPRSPRVLWVGVQAGADKLTHLHGGVESRLVRSGFGAEDKPFAPHLTLARTRKDISAAERREVAAALATVQQRATATAEFPVRAITVMRSILGRAGPTYIPVHIATLAKSEEGS